MLNENEIGRCSAISRKAIFLTNNGSWKKCLKCGSVPVPASFKWAATPVAFKIVFHARGHAELKENMLSNCTL